MKIMLIRDLDEKHINRLKKAHSDIEAHKALLLKNQKEEIKSAETVMGFNSDFSSELLDILPKAPKLKWIQSLSAGVDNILTNRNVKKLKERGIVISTAKGIHKYAITEHVMAYILTFSRNLHIFREQQNKKIWKRLELNSLENKNLVVLGLGIVGLEIAKRAKSFNMNVSGIKRNWKVDIKEVDKIYPPYKMNEAFRNAHFIVVTVPLTKETKHMIGKAQFSSMSKEAVFINIGRGETVVEEDLIESLENKEIAGAALDVFTEEPLDANSPLYGMKNVLITPHIAGLFPERINKAIKIANKNIKRYKDNRPLINLVNYDTGY